MNEKLQWHFEKIKHRVVRFVEVKIWRNSIKWKKWAGKRLLNMSECNETIFKKILSGEPFAVARMGSIEMDACIAVEKSNIENRANISFEENKMLLYNNAGMFSVEGDGIYKFVECYTNSAKEIDLLGIWFWGQEEFLIKKYAPYAEITKLSNIEPYYEEILPWSKALEGKKVLVIHPFTDTIIKQFEKKNDIWKDRQVLPEFELVTFKAVQTMCGEKDSRFETWFEALNFMKTEIEKIDFDIAILGCGAYGLPLAAAIKKMGRQAIHLGGATQILFGIIGKRWEEKAFFQKLINENWVRPNEDEKPKNAENVEMGCYW